MSKIRELTEEFLKNCSGAINVKYDEPMGPKTTFKIGGTAAVYAQAGDEKSLVSFLGFLKQNNLKFFILGGGSNIVFCDGFYDGAVVTLSRDFGGGISLVDGGNSSGNVKVRFGAGISIASLVNWCTQNEVSGLQEFAGLPGSTGGAVFMNARCFNKEISNVFNSARYIDLETLEIKEVFYNEKDWDYKKSPLGDGKKFILEAEFNVTAGEKSREELQKECHVFIEERKSKGHFEFPSAGSVFKNNHAFGKPSGAIIDLCGLKGLSFGDAQVAPFHGNIIINKGHAGAGDVKGLVEKVKACVKEKFVFDLECEIIFVE